jgi:chorismate mutase
MKFQNDILPLSSWFPSGAKPFIISGPCSAENPEQLRKTAIAIAKILPGSIFRAGIWKPRTRPNNFEGVGVEGLRWLNEIKKETGLKVATEVANAYHVEQCLKYGIDVLWIGARTTVNPFSVQEIADALKGVDIPVMIKNPVSPDLQLWVGALERINSSGINKLVAIHRGFHSFNDNLYRNAPNWEIAIELKLMFPDLSVICDPSHICGNTKMIAGVAQKALDLDMDGLMIETHFNPSEALSDATQQITPQRLSEIISGLNIRNSSSENIVFRSKLEELRAIIDKTDEDILEMISRRMNVVKEIGEYKKENQVTILQLKRWKNILGNQLHTGSRVGLSKGFIKKLYQLIHDESIRMQTEIMNKNSVEIKD